ncbi:MULTISPECIES: hypothetical protein [unclassified Streptomyces]|uniref:hypothetical protein n=1 Tax=unclassified Streptomyces TaxID=2593676 RepID=UPI00190DA5BD|nr:MULTISPECIES: hypothetical protein [unclassified Streptomyces]MBK3563852.1 hypothetical protein [Streptomyces sp. MBT62]
MLGLGAAVIVGPLEGGAAESVGLTSVADGEGEVVGDGLLVLPQPGESLVLCVQTALAGDDRPRPITADAATTLKAVARDRRLPDVLVMKEIPRFPDFTGVPRFAGRSVGQVKPHEVRLRNPAGTWLIAVDAPPASHRADLVVCGVTGS